MASDTAPAAAPGPNTPHTGTTDTVNAGSPHTPQGGLTGLLAPVQPARFNLDPGAADGTPTPAGTDDTTGISSADFHAQNSPDATTNTKANSATGPGGKAQQGVWRAWMLAGAERWKKGADARNKALDIKKARAQALQVKESRTVNRSEKLVSGSTNSGNSTQNSAGKSLNSKSSNANKGLGSSKNSSHGPKSGPGSRHGAGSGGHGGSSGGGGSHRGGGHDRRGGSSGGHGRHTGNGGKQRDSRKDPGKPSKADPGKPTSGTGTSGSGGGGGSGKGSSTRGGGSPSGKSGTSSAGGRGGTGPQGSAGKDGKPGKDTPGRGDSTKASGSKNKPGPGSTGADQPSKTDLKKKPADLERKPTSTDTSKSGKAPSLQQSASKTSTAKGTGRPLNVQDSREAGYRDGTRAATVAAHVGAWRDGVRDGWTDRQADATREKTRLDQAHADRTTQTAPAPQQKVPPMPTQQPTNQGPQPIPVLGVTQDGITLGPGADRTRLGHGEVRSLKSFERQLGSKADTLAYIADGTRSLKGHAAEQLKTVTALTEQARVVEGGDALLSALLKLEEAAQAQSMAADEVVTRAVRGHEACTVLIGNVDTRYGGIYKAVVDSGLIAPADLHYYKDSAHAV